MSIGLIFSMAPRGIITAFEFGRSGIKTLSLGAGILVPLVIILACG